MVSKCGPTTLIRHVGQVWAVPFSLATTQGITFVFFSSRYLDVSVLWVGSLSGDTPSVYQVVPFGNLRIYRLCAAPRSLSQLTTSFIVSKSQGIHHTPLSALKELLLLLDHLQLLLSQYVKELLYPSRYNADVRIMNPQAFRLTSSSPHLPPIPNCGG